MITLISIGTVTDGATDTHFNEIEAETGGQAGCRRARGLLGSELLRVNLSSVRGASRQRGASISGWNRSTWDHGAQAMVP